MQISVAQHSFHNDPSLNLKNLYSIRAVPPASAINNVLTKHVCFGIIIFLQRLNLKSIKGAGGLITSMWLRNYLNRTLCSLSVITTLSDVLWLGGGGC